jgi:sorting nexin-8
LKELLNFWADFEQQTAQMIKEYFNMFCKYGYNEIGPLKELIQERDQKFEYYEKNKGKIDAKKEKLWVSGDVNKWGLSTDDLWNANSLKNDKMLALSKMLIKENLEMDKIKDEYSFLNYQAKAEFRRFLLDSQMLENMHFTEFAKSMCNQAVKFQTAWEEFITKLSQVRSENIPSRCFISKKLKNI